MPKQKINVIYSLAAFAAGLALSSTSAYAGFQWVAPNDTPTYQAPAVSRQMPLASATTGPEIISPVVITGSPMPTAAPTNLIGSTSPVPLSDTTPTMGVMNDRTNLASEKISVSAPAPGDTVQGFASQIPLALALRQVMPVGYNFSIDQDVGMDTLVSYKGGKPWRETLRDMLSAAGLVAREQGTSLIISHAANNMAEPASEPAPIKPAMQPAFSMPSHNNDVPSFNVGAVDGWTAARGDTLRKVLSDWCRRSNVELQWEAEYDYPLEASAHFSGGFEEAVRGLLAGFDGVRPQPIGELHTNSSAGQMVLVIQARGNNYSN